MGNTDPERVDRCIDGMKPISDKFSLFVIRGLSLVHIAVFLAPLKGISGPEMKI